MPGSHSRGREQSPSRAHGERRSPSSWRPAQSPALWPEVARASERSAVTAPVPSRPSSSLQASPRRSSPRQQSPWHPVSFAAPPPAPQLPQPPAPPPSVPFPLHVGPLGVWDVAPGGQAQFHPFHNGGLAPPLLPGQLTLHPAHLPQRPAPPPAPPVLVPQLPGFEYASGRAPFHPPLVPGPMPAAPLAVVGATEGVDLDAGESAAAPMPRDIRPPRRRSVGVRLSSRVIVERIRARTRAPPRSLQLSSKVLVRLWHGRAFVEVRLWHGRAFVEVVTNVLEAALGAMEDCPAAHCRMDADRTERCQLAVRDLVHELERTLVGPDGELGSGVGEACVLEEVGDEGAVGISCSCCRRLRVRTPPGR
ncbi:unnamed protein product [Closterium sp. NIES-65]|nr:unnamed protein product [Closterium sp. NIES-65]